LFTCKRQEKGNLAANNPNKATNTLSFHMYSQFCEHKNKEKLTKKFIGKLSDIYKQEITGTTYSPSPSRKFTIEN
jgi:hypothetical protein